MNQDFINWLHATVCEVKADLILSGFEAIRNLGETGSDTEFGLLWQDQYSTPSENIIDDIYAILRAGLTKVILMHGVTLDNSDINLLTKFAECLRQLNDSEEHDAISNLIERDEGNVMKLAEIIGYLRNENWSVWSNVILQVSDVFFERLADIHQVYTLETTPLIYLKEALEQYVRFYPGRMVNQALDAGIMPATSMTIVIEHFKEKLEQLAPNNARDAAIEFAGLGILSSADKIGLTNKITEKLGDVYTDIDFISNVRAELLVLFGELKLYG